MAHATETTGTETTRRDFLMLATGAAGIVGAGAVLVPLISQLAPDAQTVAAGAPIDLDLSPIAEGQAIKLFWRGKLIFVDRPLGDVIDELNRYHRGRLQIIDPAIRSHRVSGVFSTGDPLAVVDALEASLGLHSTRLTRYLVLLHR